MTHVNVSDIVKQVARRSNVTTWKACRLTVGKVTPNAIGVETGESETVIDQRDGWERQRPRFAFLPRRFVRVISGALRAGEEIVADLPHWLIERERLQGMEIGT